MYHIIYLSKAAYSLPDAQLQDLLEQARQNNATQHISGMLLHGNGQFFQVLEGEKEVVEALYERIKQDPRHHNVTTFASKEVKERSFADWGMAFNPLTPQQFLDFAGFISPADLRLDRAPLSLADQQLLRLLRVFVLPEA